LTNGNRLIDGEVWDIDLLDSGACVSVWKKQGNPEAPDVSCEEVSQHSVGNKDRFWGQSYDVYYAGLWLVSCAGDQDLCSVTIPAELVENNDRIEQSNDDDE
jgi:hypothetical protein